MAMKVFNKLFKISLLRRKKKNNNLKESYYDFLIYYNDKEYSTTEIFL